MTVEQIYQIVNTVTEEVLGDSVVVEEDLSNIVSIGDTIENLAAMDRYVRSLVDHIGKVIFVNRVYRGSTPSVMMDGWEYGAILEKVTYDDLPEATENESWELEDQQTYEQDMFYQPKVSAKFFSKKTTFEIPMSFAERQVKSAFDNVSQLNSFFSMIETAIQTSMTIKTDGLIERTINNMIGETLSLSTPGVKVVNLLKDYNTKFNKNLTLASCITDPEFIRYSSLQFMLWSDRMTKASTMFNAGGKVRHTPKEAQHLIMLSEFRDAAGVYLQSDTFHNEYTALPNAESVAYWQGSGTDFGIASTSLVKCKTAGGSTVNQAGVLGVMFDRNALGVANLDRRVTTHYNAKAEFYNNWYKADAGYFNDLNENFVVFIADPS